MSDSTLDNFWDEIFNSTGKNHEAWFFTAEQLKTSADLVWNTYQEARLKSKTNDDIPRFEIQNIEIWRVALLLAGLSIENLLKALIV